jgi:hypothetical protein
LQYVLSAKISYTGRLGIRINYRFFGYIRSRISEYKRPLGRPRHRWEDNIKMDFEYKGVDWIQLAQERNQWQAVVNTLMKIQVP